MPGRESGVDPPGGMEPAAAPPGAGRVAVSPASSPSAGFPQLREGSPGCSETSSGIAGVATLLHPRTASSVGSGEAGGGRAAVARGRPGGSAGSGGTEGSPGGGGSAASRCDSEARGWRRRVSTKRGSAKLAAGAVPFAYEAASVRGSFRGTSAEPALPPPQSPETNAANERGRSVPPAIGISAGPRGRGPALSAHH